MSVAGIVATPMDTSVNYEEFLKILSKAGNTMGDLNQDEAGPHLINVLRD